jgi:4-amino-4-deoxy-L-arabinose transferase-like glycosyltransferase
MPVLLLLFNAIIGFNGLYGQDSFEYLRYSKALRGFLTDGASPGHFWWPPLYPLAGTLLSFFLPAVFSLQAVSIIAYGLTCLFLQKILNNIYSDKQEIKLYIFLFISLSPFFMRYSSTVMSESLAMAFITGFFYFYLLFTGNKDLRYLLLAVGFGCAAINTRYASFILLMIPGIHILYLFFINFRFKYLVYSLVIVLLIFMPNIYLHLYQPGSIVGQTHFSNWSFLHYFQRSFITADGALLYTLPNIIYVFSILVNPGFIFPGILFIIFFRINTLNTIFMKFVATTMLLYALFLAGLTFQNDRVLILSFPLVLILFFGSFQDILDRFEKTKKSYHYMVVILVIIIQLALFYRAFKPFYENNRITRQVSLEMLHYPDKPIYTFNIDMALRAYGIKNEIINLWEKRLAEFKPGSLVLFNYLNSQDQWKGMNPMLNWDQMNREHHLNLRENLSGGWALYEITD